MPKSQVDLREGLRRAALELFGERGYEQTTAAGIAARAGVTERTFFRYFPDKREVLFEGEAVLRAALTAAVAAAPARLGPMATLHAAFRSTVPLLEAGRPYAVARQAVIVASPALSERELAKTAALADALVTALAARGVASFEAGLAARTGMAVFVHVAIAWLADPEPALEDRLERAFVALRRLSAEVGASP